MYRIPSGSFGVVFPSGSLGLCIKFHLGALGLCFEFHLGALGLCFEFHLGALRLCFLCVSFGVQFPSAFSSCLGRRFSGILFSILPFSE